jgi:hypothetical protein
VLRYLLVLFRDLGDFRRIRKAEILRAFLMHTSLDVLIHGPRELERMWGKWVRFMEKREKPWGNCREGRFSQRGERGFRFNIGWAALRGGLHIWRRMQEEYTQV